MLRIAFGQKHDKFVPSEAYGKIAVADGLLEPGGELVKRKVACRVPGTVVDLLEIVQIKHDHGQGIVLPAGPGNFQIQVLHQKVAVVEMGEGIDQSQFAQVHGVEFLLGDDPQLPA